MESDLKETGLPQKLEKRLMPTPPKTEAASKSILVDEDSDIDPDDLLPVYIDCKVKLFHLQPSVSKLSRRAVNDKNLEKVKSSSDRSPDELESARLMRKIGRIESDVLFDKYLADQQWEARRIQLEKDAAISRRANALKDNDKNTEASEAFDDSDNEISREAARIGAAMLEELSDDGGDLGDLFSSLPTNEVDPATGKSMTVVSGSDGVKVQIRDFGKWTGVNPTRVLEEACRAR